MKMEEIMLDEVQQGFVIDDDQKAEWALRKIKEREDECRRIEALARADIDRASKLIEEEKAKCDRDNNYLRELLRQYMATVKCRETTSGQKKYKLLTGELVEKPGGLSFAKDDGALLDYLLRGGRTDLIKTVQSPKWNEFKKQCTTLEDGSVVDTETGEIVEGVTAERKPDTFEIKWRE